MSTLLLIACLAQPLQARDSMVSVSFSVINEPVKLVLQRLEGQTGYKFFYVDKQVDVERTVTLTLYQVSLEDALRRLFANTSTTFVFSGKQIVLKRTRKAPQTAAVDTADVLSGDGRAAEALITLPLPSSLDGRDTEISGRVTAETGEPLPGVNIIIKGTTRGTTTDVNGNYVISVPDGQAVLVFNFIGFKPQEVVVGAQTVVNVVLAVDITTLDEMVVIGYGATSRRSLAGAVSSVRSADLVTMKAPSVDAMLQGQGTGIQVSQATGVPGGPVRVMVRGTSSISAGTEPLWVIDGIPLTNELGIGGAGRGVIPQNPLASINPNDIESVEVLKDASATAIYGSRGSNGVIIVTTKSGKGSQGSLSFDATYGMTELTRPPEEMGFANTDEWLDIVNTARRNSGLTTDVETELNNNPRIANFGPDRVDPANLGNYSPFDEILRSGRFQEYNLSNSTGFEKGSLFISANYRTDQGVLQNNNFDRLSFRVNAEYLPTPNLTTGTRINLSHTKNERALDGGQPCCNDQVATGGFGEAAVSALPFIPMYKDDGTYFNPYSGLNLAATTDRDLFRDEFITYRVLGGIYFDYKVPFVDGLSFRTEFSADVLSSNRLFWASQELRPSGLNYAENSTGLSQNLNYNIFAKFNRTFADAHRVSIVAGSESQEFSGRSTNMSGEGIPGRNQDFGSPTVARAPSGGFGGERYIRSYFGRAEYFFKDRYIVGGSFRRDGVSIFREDYRHGNFSALSIGWIFSEENFMKPLSFLSFGKVRASFGQTGNQSIDANATFTTTVTWPRYGSADGSQLMNNVGVEDLKWETTNSYDVAVELGFLNDRITFSGGYYRQDVSDLLFRVPLSPSVGFFEGSSMWANVADLRNEGFEFSLNTINFDRGEFRWSTSFNITTNRNEILSIIPALDERGNGVGSGITRNIAGRPLSTFFLAEYAGIDPKTGVPMIYEIDRENFSRTGQTRFTGNVIPASRDNLQAHRVLQDETGLPKFFGGITNTFQYKGFHLTALLTFQGGNYLYNQAEINAMNVGQGRNNLFSDLLENSWTPENPDARYPLLTWNGRYHIDNAGNPVFNADGTPNLATRYDETSSNDRASTRHLYKGDFMRLRSVELAYVFTSPFIQKAGLKSIRAFVNGNNLMTFTRFPGWDPEQLNFAGDSQSRNLNQGVVTNRLPQLKSYAAGLNLTF